jgi:hypothetical protein
MDEARDVNRAMEIGSDLSGLPPELAGLARAVAARTGLPKGERARVAGAVAAEIRSLLEAGVLPADVPAKLGDLGEVAAAQRKRVVRERGVRMRVWRLAAGGWKGGVLAVLGGLAVVYAVLFVRYHTGRPTIARNMLEEFNAPYVRLADEERAEPAYAAAHLMVFDDPALVERVQGWLKLQPGDAGWGEVETHLRAVAPALALTRRAAGMRVFGHICSDSVHGSPWRADGGAGEAPPSENPAAIEVMLPHLGPMRLQAQHLAMRALAAAAEGDGAGAAKDVQAMLGMVRHVREQPFLVNDLVSLAVLTLAAERAGLIVWIYPGVFSEEQLEELAGAFAALDDGIIRLRLEGERAFIADVLQRMYTDNGRGSGRLTPEGVRWFDGWFGSTDSPRPGAMFVDPVLSVAAPSRAMVQAEWELIAATALRDAGLPPPQRSQFGSEHELMELKAQLRRYDVIPILMPALDSAMHKVDEARLARDGAIAALAIERHRLRHGAYPGSIEEVWLEQPGRVAPDPYDQWLLKYVLRKGRPVLYSVGPDGVDDGGDFGTLGTRNRPVDVLLWPPAERAEGTGGEQTGP